MMLRTYDAASEFTHTPGDNASDKTWTYGYFSGGNPRTLVLYDRLDNPAGQETIWRWSASHVRGYEPSITCNLGTHPFDKWPVRDLALHPGRHQQRSAVVWQTPPTSSAPTDPIGDVLLMGAFIGLDHNPTTHVWIHHLSTAGDNMIFSGYVETFHASLSFYRCARILPGDQIIFSVGTGRDGDYVSDTTGLQIIITPVNWLNAV